MIHWQPSASIEVLRQRSELLRQIRDFFYQRHVLEVDTPALMEHSVTDPYMTALEVVMGKRRFYLQTSPEYAMKRLLAAGSGDIYQLSKNYRADEVGSKHQPEFTMLEWYRLAWNHHQLMDEVFDLVAEITTISARENFTYQQAFENFLSIDPFDIDDKSLKQLAESHFGKLPEDLFRDDYLTLLFAEKIEPQLGRNAIAFVYDFPASQSALAKVLPDNPKCAARFEVYCQGMELANGFWELTDPKEQRQRFIEDNKKRQQMGRPTIEIDEAFLAAIEAGLPECSGVALGVDRLIMLALNQTRIEKVLPFAIEP
jgi:lysyl-tRNA synthetase class 2